MREVAMPERFALHRDPRNREVLHELIQARGLPAGSYALFFVAGEGTALPISLPGDDVEERSGYVIDRHGRVFYFWLGWDAEAQAVALTTWEKTAPEPWWATVPEYQHARHQLDLPAA
jgi:hypothetical protein